MTQSERRTIRRITLALDSICLLVSFLAAMVTRYGGDGWAVRWQLDLYSLLLVVEVLVYWAIFHYRYHIKGRPLITEQDVVDGFLSACKNNLLAWACLMLVLVAARVSERLSRLVYIYILIYNIVLIYPVRMLLRHYLIIRRRRMTLSRRFLVVTNMQSAESVLRHLTDTLPYRQGVVGAVIYDQDMQGQVIADISIIGNRRDMFNLSSVADEVFVFLPDLPNDALREIVTGYHHVGLDVNLDLNYVGYHITGRMLRNIGDYSTAYFTAMTDRCSILGTQFAATDLNSAVSYIKQHVRDLAGEYICFSNVHTTVMAKENWTYHKVLAGAALVFPDGKPIANSIVRRGYSKAERIGGPDFMENMFRASMDGSVRHYFYGSDPETVARLRVNLERKYPGIQIAGVVSPPYRELTPEEDEAAVRAMNESGADLIWIGLGAPKQENWMAAHKGRVNGVMLGVGAGFNFHAGTVKRAPVWMQRVSLEWLYRLCQDPKRLFTRYLYTNTRFLWYSLWDRGER